MKWGPGEQGRVPIFFPPGTAAGVDAPAIPDNEHDGASHIRRTLPMISAIDKWSFVDNVEPAPLHRRREVAQSDAGASLFARLCRGLSDPYARISRLFLTSR